MHIICFYSLRIGSVPKLYCTIKEHCFVFQLKKIRVHSCSFRQTYRPLPSLLKSHFMKNVEKSRRKISVVKLFYVKFEVIKIDSTIYVSSKFSESFSTNILWKTFKSASFEFSVFEFSYLSNFFRTLRLCVRISLRVAWVVLSRSFFLVHEEI